MKRFVVRIEFEVDYWLDMLTALFKAGNQITTMIGRVEPLRDVSIQSDGVFVEITDQAPPTPKPEVERYDE